MTELTDPTIRRTIEGDFARLSRILDMADDAIISTDQNQNITLFNQGAEKIFGYSASEILGQPIDILLLGRFSETQGLHLADFGSSDYMPLKDDERREVFGLRKNGQGFPAEASISKLEIDGDRIFTVILRDISERKQMEGELRLATDELESRVKERTVELECANNQLQQEIAERNRVEALMSASLEEKELLLKEIHHRVKNNLQIISSLLNLQSGYLSDPRAVEVFKDCQLRVAAMGLVHEQLYRSGNQSGVDLPSYIRLLINDLLISYGASRSRIELKLDLKHVFVNIDTAIPCSLIITELVSNSLKHAFPDERKGQINISLHPKDDDSFELIVSDNGVGLPEGLDYRKTTSLGLRLVNALTAQLRGKVEFRSNNGTEVRISGNSAQYKERI